MTISVRSVDLETERTELLSILGRNLPEIPHARRFEWLYRNHPAGASWAWFAYDAQNRRPVGAASVFPRAMWAGDKVQICGQVGDFAIDREYRSLGPALALQRATFVPVQQGTLGWTYDCPPHERGMSTFRRLGMSPNTRMQRYVRLLRTSRQVGKVLGNNRLAETVARLGDRLLPSIGRRECRVPGVEIVPLTGDFGEEFSELDKRVGNTRGVRSRRRAEDLNWRYRNDPLHNYQVLLARCQGDLLAFAVFTLSQHDCRLMDVFGLSLEHTGPLLADAVAEIARNNSLYTVQAAVGEDDRLKEALHHAGFRHRGPAPYVVAYALAGGECDRLMRTQPKWFFQQVDITA